MRLPVQTPKVFTTAESSGSTAKIVTEVKSFVENYNAFASAVKEMGGSENTTYLEQMNELLSKDSDAYEKSVLHLQKTVH